MEQEGASVVITHHITKGREKAYEKWLNEISPLCKSSEGFVDWQIIRPIPGLTFVFTMIIRFNSVSSLKTWMESSQRKNMIEKAAPLFAQDDQYIIKSGLDFLFRPDGEQQQVPPRWKQYLVTWSAIYPLSVLIPMAVLPILRSIHVPENRYINSFFISATIVLLMVYVVMPNYSKFLKKWLYK